MYLCFRKKSDNLIFDAETLDDTYEKAGPDAAQPDSVPKKSSSKKVAKGKTTKKAGKNQKAGASKTYEPPKIKMNSSTLPLSGVVNARSLCEKGLYHSFQMFRTGLKMKRKRMWSLRMGA